MEEQQKNLKQKASSGMMWTAIQKYSLMIIQFISGIILARLLTPYDYGCIGLLAIFMTVAEVFIDAGFDSALIQKKKPTQADYSTIFFWNLGMAVLMYAVLFFSAPAISRFYNIPLLCNVLRVQGLVLFIYAFNIIQRNQLRKNLKFKVLSIVSLASSIIALSVTIIMAYYGFGVWALVAQHLVVAAVPAIVYWFLIKWRPSLVFSWRSFKELFSFGVYMFLSLLVNRFGQQIQGVLIGKFYNPSTMGYYSKAQGTEKLASTSISKVMTEVTYPLYVEVQDNKEAMQSMVKRLTTTLAYITFPLMFILILCAKPIFILLYSDRWIQSVPYFQVLCLAGLSACLQSANLQTLAAIGKSRVMFHWTLLKMGVKIGLVVGGLALWGMKGLLLGVVLSSWFEYFVNICLVSKHIGYKWWKQLLDLMPVTVAAISAAIISYLCGYFLKLDLYLDGIVKCIIYVVVYLGWSFVFKPEAYTYFLTIIPARLKLWDRNKKDQVAYRN